MMPERRCAWCRHSVGTVEGLCCRVQACAVARNAFCYRFEREPGADDE